MSNTELHIKAYLTNFEVALEAGILVIIADILWLLHDILVNGLSVYYTSIGLLMSIGLLISIYALYKHHRAYTHRLMKKYLIKQFNPDDIF